MEDQENNNPQDVQATKPSQEGATTTNTDVTGKAEEIQNEVPEVEKGLSPVAAITAKNKVIVIIIMVALIAIVLKIFLSDSPEQAKKKVEEQKEKQFSNVSPQRPTEFADSMPQIPVLPEAPSVTPPQAPPIIDEPKPAPSQSEIKLIEPVQAPMPIIDEKKDEPIAPIKDTQSDKRKMDKRKSGIVFGGGNGGGGGSSGGGGGSGGATDSADAKANQAKTYSNSEIHNFVPEVSSFERVSVTRVGDMSATIVQGKMIDAVMETAINTDLSGKVRAIITRDVYSESGKNVLIPKGSRAIGSYDNAVKYGQTRLTIVWSRIIRPDGIDVAIQSPGTDSIGRAGIDGVVDNKYLEVLTNALMTSTVNVLWTKMADQVLGSGAAATTTSTNASTGETTTSTTATNTDTAIADAQGTLQSAFENITSNAGSNTSPTISISQGQKFKIQVARDLIFSNDVANNIQVVQ